MATASPNLFALNLEKYEGEAFCVIQWEEAFGESLSFTDYVLAYHIVFVYTYTYHPINHNILHHPCQAQVTKDSRSTID